jgi:hypothetical protein
MHLKDLISIFQLSFSNTALSLHMHILHTSIYADERFGSEQRHAKRAFSNFFAMDATHHFVDSLPDQDNPQSVYFSNQAIALFLTEMQEQRSFRVTDLKYRKSDAHVASDQILKAAYIELESLQRTQKEDASALGKKAQKAKKPLIAMYKLYQEQAERIKKEIKPYDDDPGKRVLVNEDSCSV